jgi:hypothetical protein
MVWTLMDRRGPFSHHWLEVETSSGVVTLGFGPATIPLIDSGQIALRDARGNIQRISGFTPFPIFAPPPMKYHYARKPEEGKVRGRPIVLTQQQADALVHRIQTRKFIAPYFPWFHDCRTFVCTVRAEAEGRSKLPCYLLLKGYW